MKKRISLFMITFMAAVCFSLSGVFAATYSKSKTASVSYNTQCTGRITYTNERKKAIHNVGYYFYNSTGNHVGGNVKQFTFTYTSGSGVS